MFKRSLKHYIASANYEKPTPDELLHYGMPRRSGRYPWGSGEDPYQHSGDFLARYNQLREDGYSEAEIAKEFDCTTTQLRIQKSYASNTRRAYEVEQAKSLMEDCNGNVSEVARKMGKNESSVRSLLNANSEKNTYAAKNTADQLMQIVKEGGMVDVGAGVEHDLGVSRKKLDDALYICELNGYPVYSGRVQQVTNKGKYTTQTVLCPPGTEHKEIYNLDEVHTVSKYHSTDNGDTFTKLEYPKSLDSSRIYIRYGDEGGKEKDGVIELRRGVEDISLGGSQYAQVRVAVDGTHYLKGMAVYGNDIPDGYDVVFNTNKASGTPQEKVFKKLESTTDAENAFGATIKAGGQRHYTDKDGKDQLSVINKVKEEGDWDHYSDTLASQFLSKQPQKLIDSQLKLTYENKYGEYEEIMALTNNTVKKYRLKEFADECDGASVHLKADALPRQSWQVILPVTSLKDDEIYAPNYKDGEKLALVRYPHGGTFEIPIVTVNNSNKEAKAMLGTNPIDAVCINSKVAERLSGADFDGDTVLCIPTNSKTNIKSTPALKGLENFDPKESYPYKEGMKVMSPKNKQIQMGIVSNLITDMTLQGAPPEDIAAAVRHSMVVIDSEKHKLNYKQSEIDNNIAYLKKKYQGHYNEEGEYHEGASTLISKAKHEINVPETRGSVHYNEDGSTYYNPSNRTYVDKNGKVVLATKKSTLMAETKDARTLSSGTAQEEAYAEYANKMKALANAARKEMLSTPNQKYSPEAKSKYADEVASLNKQLMIAESNKPREREAQRIANTRVKALKQSNPEQYSDKDDLKKLKQRELKAARNSVGASKTQIYITDKEWEAIQSGAVTETTLSKILLNADDSRVKQLATPKETKELSTAQVNRIKRMAENGYSTSAIAEALGISTSTVSYHIHN